MQRKQQPTDKAENRKSQDKVRANQCSFSVPGEMTTALKFIETPTLGTKSASTSICDRSLASNLKLIEQIRSLWLTN
tara:strand:- start:243 stop:473 length:231 start_codon:yes stop_codon:yes gene_type:complete